MSSPSSATSVAEPPPAAVEAADDRVRAGQPDVALVAVRPRVVGARQAVVLALLVSIPLGDVVAILRGEPAARQTWTAIVIDLRLPRAITAVLAGTATALAGLVMQTLFRNALAEPYVLGVTAGGSLGVGLILLPQGASAGLGAVLLAAFAPVQSIGVVGAAALGALAVLALMSAVAARVRNLVVVLVAGMMVSAFITAVVNVLVFFARPEAVVAFTAWQFGTFQGVRMAQLPILAVTIGVGVLLLALSTKQLNASLLGERYAQSMGMSVRRLRLLAMVSTALLAGAVTAFAGPIAFLGIAAPHLARGLLGSADHRVLIPGAALTGTTIALAAGVLAQLPGTDAVLPLNAALALIGAPVVLHVLLRLNRTGGGFAV
jgi:iron complex transport system permease protein